MDLTLARHLERRLTDGGQMLDHLIMTVFDFESSRNFYAKSLEPLGY